MTMTMTTTSINRRLNRAQVRQLIADQLRDTPTWANNRIAQALGVDAKTVAAERRRLEATGEIHKLTNLVGADGRTRSGKRPATSKIPKLSAGGAPTLTTPAEARVDRPDGKPSWPPRDLEGKLMDIGEQVFGLRYPQRRYPR
jgi:hypothetical protein